MQLGNNSTELSREIQLLMFYASKLGIDLELHSQTEATGNVLFSEVLRDFKSGAISLDDLSALCGLMYDKFDFNSDIFDILQLGAEIHWYIRNNPPVALDFLSDFEKFFSTKNPYPGSK